MKNEVEKYDFDIVELIKTSFKMTDGFKGKFWSSLGVMMVIFLIFIIVFSVVSTVVGIDPDMAGNLANLIMLPIITPIAAGLFMLVANHTRGVDVGYKNIFDYFGSMWKLTFAYLLTVLIAIAPLVLGLVFASSITSNTNVLLSIILPMLALLTLMATISYTFAPQLIVDKGYGIWEAMEHSRKATWQHMFKILGLLLAFSAILIVSAIPFGIGLIWTMPAMYLGTYGLLYRIMFDGVELNTK